MSAKHTDQCRKTWRPVEGGFFCDIHKEFIDREVVFADDAKKIFDNEGKTCLDCKHYDGEFSCPAFPEVIPQPFLSGMERHVKPKYGQENKIVFELKK